MQEIAMENVKKIPTKLEKLIFTLKLLYRATGIIFVM